MQNKTALPTMLSFHAPDLREQIEAMPEGTALIGISTTGRAIAVDLDAEFPHILVCTASGGSSTTVLRSLTAQFLHQGAHALVHDPKRISHLWAKAPPSAPPANRGGPSAAGGTGRFGGGEQGSGGRQLGWSPVYR